VTRLTHFPRFPVGKHPSGSGNRSDERPALRSAREHEGLRRRSAEKAWGLPEGLLDIAINSVQGGMCTSITNRGRFDTSLRELWNVFSGYVFLHPFGLAAPNSVHCHESTVQQALQKNGNVTMYVARDRSQKLPFLVSQAAILAPLSGRHGSLIQYWPIEDTPLYTGTFQSYSGTNATPFGAMGDILTEAFAWPGEVLNPVPLQPITEVSIRRTPHLGNLGQLAMLSGMETAYAADFQLRDWTHRLPECVVAAFEMLMPHAPISSPLLTDQQGVPATQELAIGDAGIYDDLGHIPLLRRRITKIVIYDSSAVHDNSTGTDMENLCQMVYTRRAFGQSGCPDVPWPDSPPVTVFEPSEFGPFWSQVVQLHRAGLPVVVRGRFTVVDNPHLGIVGGWQADVLWIIALPVRAWRQSLPRATDRMLKRYFPNYFAGEMNNRFVISAASQLASWLTKFAMPEIQQMLAEQPTPPKSEKLTV